jgi:hypothetical protein
MLVRELQIADWLHIAFLLGAVALAVVAAVGFSIYLNNPARKRSAR